MAEVSDSTGSKGSPEVIAMENTKPNPEPQKELSEEEKSSWLSVILLSFLTPMLKIGGTRQLNLDDLPVLHSQLRSKEVSEEFAKVFDEERKKASPSLLRAYWKVAGKFFYYSIPFLLVQAAGPFLSPLLLELVLSSFSSADTPWWQISLYVVAMATGNFFTALSIAQGFRFMFQLGIGVNAANVSALYRKGLLLSTSARQVHSQGKIMNHLSTDAQTVFNFSGVSMLVIVMPIQLTLALYMLFTRLGVAVWVAMGVIVFSGPLNGFLGSRFSKIAKAKLLKTDARLKLVNDVISGIRLVKYYAWEKSFEKRVAAFREGETDQIKRYLFNMAVLMASIGFVPVLVTIGTFGTYVALGGSLSAQLVFPALSLLQLLQMPLSIFPMLLGFGIGAAVSLKRIKKFLLEPEREASPHDPVKAEQVMAKVYGGQTAIGSRRVVIKDGVFRWKDPAVIKAAREAEEKEKARKANREGKRKTKKIDAAAGAAVGSAAADASSAPESEKTQPAGDDAVAVDVVQGEGETDAQKIEEADEKPTLPLVNLEVSDGELVMIVGPVGSGKSSVLAALLGDITCLSGDVAVRGTLAFVAQRPWVQTSTVRENVIGSRPYDEARFRQVIKACVLGPDIDMLPAGDNTEVGERGINLSGGQLARLSLAQALYADADVVLLDDILSQVDAHVGRRIFENVLHPTRGMLKKKAVVLVTNQLQYLAQSTRVVCLSEDCRVEESGTFDELMAAGLDFQQLINVHAKSQDDEDSGKMLRSSSTKGDLKTDQEEQRKGKPAEVVDVSQGKLVSEEERVAGAVAWPVYKKMFLAAGAGIISAYVCFMVTASILKMGTQGWLSVWTDGSWFPGQSNEFYLVIYGSIIALGLIVQLTADLTYARAIIRTVKRSHDRLFKNILRAPMAFFDTTPTGRLINRFSKDVFQMDMEMPQFVNQVFMFTLMMSVMLAFVAVTVYPSIIALIPGIYLFYRLQAFYRASAREIQRLDSTSKSHVVAHFGESLNGVSSIWAYRLVDFNIAKNFHLIDENHRAFYTVKVAVRWLNVRGGTIGAVILALTGIALGFMRDVLPPSFAGLALVMLNGVLQMLSHYVANVTELETRMTSVERIQSYAEINTEPADGVEPESSWPHGGAIAFEKYSMRYRPNLDLVLRNVSFFIKAGEKVGVVGRTGAGKSSLAVALFRIVEPASGQITIDNQNVSQLNLQTLRSRMSIIPQQPTMFEGTVRFNLDPFSEYTDQQIWGCLEIVQLKETIGALVQKLETPVTEGGTNFSVGQRQLVCIARALLRKSQIILLDEATASVDVETDSIIQKMVREHFKQCTVMTIAHRLNTIIDSDRIMVMEKGTVGELGAPADLLANKNSLLSELVDETGAQNAAHLRELASKAARHALQADSPYLTRRDDAPDVGGSPAGIPAGAALPEDDETVGAEPPVLSLTEAPGQSSDSSSPVEVPSNLPTPPVGADGGVAFEEVD